MTEIAYQIDAKASEEKGLLIIALIEATKERFGYQFSLSTKPKTLAQWKNLAEGPLDQAALTFLVKKESEFQQESKGRAPDLKTVPLLRVHIKPLFVLEALKLLERTQKVICEGKQLVIDFFGGAAFYYFGIPLPGGKLQLEGRIKTREKEFALSSCKAILPGTPPFILNGIQLQLLSTQIGWKELQEIFRAPLILQPHEKQAFLEELDREDDESPQLVIKEGDEGEALQQILPHPLLTLTDRWGACANLTMQYGEELEVPYEEASPFVKDKKGKPLFKRNLEAERQWEKDLLETDYKQKISGNSFYYCPLSDVPKSLAFLIEIGWKLRDWRGRSILKAEKTEINPEEKGDLIVVKGNIRYEDFDASLESILGAFNRRETFIELSPNTIGILPIDSSPIQQLAEECEIVGGELKIKKVRLGAISSVWDFVKRENPLFALKEKWQSFSGIQERVPSTSFKGKLRPYQQIGVNWLSFLHEYGFGGILADEMGLGKTVQLLAFLSTLPKEEIHLILMPTSLLFNWKNESRQFLPDFSVKIHHGPSRSQKAEELKNYTLILTSYTTFRLDISLFKELSPHSLILDEAQIIKNAETQIAQTVRQLATPFRLSITGTPIENKLEELWSHFHFLMPDLFGSKERFQSELAAGQSDRRFLERIKRKVAPFLLRRKKEEVLDDLPPRIDQWVWVEMEEEQRTLYEKLLAGFKSGLLKKVRLEGVSKHRLEVFEAILRLRQVCCHPLLVSSLIDEKGEKAFKSAKFEALVGDLETIIAEGRKVLVYSQFTSLLKIMTAYASEKNWSFVYLDGSTKNREEVVKKFQEEPTLSLFFISLKAGGVGLNLTAADYVYLFDPWWNSAVEEQAINRAHRIGRKESVVAKRFLTLESIEEKMMRLKEAKADLAENLFDLEGVSSPFSMEELDFLFD